jgi:alpha-L-fucosidase
MRRSSGKERKSVAQLNRRELFRLAGAGTAAMLVSGAAQAAPSPGRAGGPVPAAISESEPPKAAGCWEAATGGSEESAELRRQALAWWRDAKFGMFIHWGPCSLASVEISWPIMVPDPKWGISEAEYVNLYKRFNPVRYDPDAWVELARAAGQRYMIFTSKHHDGFCMFDSSFTDYKITRTPYAKDVAKMLADACARRDMPLGFYYSPPDMHHPAYRDTRLPASRNWRGEPARAEWPLYLDYMALQVRELLCRYGPVRVVWFDGLDHQEKYDGYRFTGMIGGMSPGTLVNNRIGVEGDFETPEQWVPKRIPVKGVRISGTSPEEAGGLPTGLPTAREFKPWDSCMTINDTWAYNRNDRKFKSSEQLVRTLVEVAAKGGNLLLNVGPGPDGTIQPEFQERLRAIGKWLKANGESIYGTTYGPLQDLSFGYTTSRGNTVYLHVFDWPVAEKLEIPRLPVRIENVRLLASGQGLHCEQSEKQVTIQVPPQAPDKVDTVLAITTA